MSRPRSAVRYTLVALAVVLLAGGVQGCKPTADGGPVDKKALRAAKRADKGAGKRAARQAARFSGAFAGPTGAAKKKAYTYDPGFGYIVKGTDFLTFWPCDSVGYFYLSAAGLVNSKISQQYKFSSPRPYVPMYAELRLRYVDSTITRGDRVFARYVDVVAYTARSRDEAKCPAPSRNTLSNEMERLDKFKPEILTR